MAEQNAAFGWGVTMEAPAGEGGDYVSGMQLSRMMYEAAMDYLAAAANVSHTDALAAQPIRPVLRSVTAQFDSKLYAGELVRVGVRAVSRTARSFVLAQEVLRMASDERIVASGTVSFVMVDLATGGAVEIPPALWDRIEEFDGSRTEVTSR